MKYSVITFGCRVNQADSLGFEEEFVRRGAEVAGPEVADVVVVNTCSVTASADQAARQTVRRIARSNPGAKIVVTGCYATRRPDEIAALPNVVAVAPNTDKPRLMALVGARLRGSSRAVGSEDDETADEETTALRFGDGEGSCGATLAPGIAGRTTFTMRVQTGCAESCSYCIIPVTRGNPQSRRPEALLEDIARVEAAGFKEVVLTGVHLGSYGRDLNPASSLADLLSAIAARRSNTLFRISSLEPMDCSPEVIALVAGGGSYAPHLHLPLQHADNEMLRSMRRPYTVERYADLVNEVRCRIPDASIGSDVIVGFPGETDKHFEQLVRYLERSPLTHLHVFPYSDRPGTVASSMTGKVHGTAVRERASRIRAISVQLARQFRDSQIGRVHRGLTIEDGSVVVTGNYLKLKVAPGVTRNEWVQVRVISDQHGELLGG